VASRRNNTTHDLGLLNALADLASMSAVLHQASKEVTARLG